MRTFYDTLEVSRTAGGAVIAAAHKTLARRFHPDNRQTANPEKFRRVQEAFEVLSDPARRAEYDKWIDAQAAAGKKARAAHKEERAPAPGLPIDQLLVNAGVAAIENHFGHIPGVKEFVKGMEKPARQMIRERLTGVAAAIGSRRVG
jgi:DnaJ-class molecular chaperone